MNSLYLKSIPLIILALFCSCKENLNPMDYTQTLNFIEHEVLKEQFQESGESICPGLNDKPLNEAHGCYLSKVSSQEIFQAILKALESENHKYIATIRQDYGAWNTVMRKDSYDIIIRAASLDGSKSGDHYKYKQKGFHTKINISIIPSE